MKILILLSLFMSICCGQYSGNSKYNDYINRPAAETSVPYVWDGEALAYFASLSTTLSDSQKININDFVIDLKDSLSVENLATVFSWFNLLANETAEAALKNVFIPASYTTTTSGTITFEAFRGYTGNASNGYLNSNFTPSLDTTVAGLNDASFGIYFRAATDKGSIEAHGAYSTAGVSKRTQLDRPNGGSDYYDIAINSALTGVASTDEISGMFIASRVASNNIKIFANSTQKHSATTVTSGLVDQVINVCASMYDWGGRFGYENDQVAVCFYGRGLTGTEVRKVTNCVERYLDSIGAGVVP